MAVTLGGSNGITFPDASNTSAANVTSQFSPMITDTANVMVLSGGPRIIGSSGVFANGVLSTAARVAVTQTYSVNTANATLNLSTLSGYVAGKSDITVTINSGIYVYSTSTAGYGLDISGATTGDTITIVNNGFIMGQGGAGGNPGSAGGPAINIASIGVTGLTITNTSGYIGGGGGGGNSDASAGFSSGGGGAGGGAGGGGAGGAGGSPGAAGSNGTGNGGGGGGRIMPGTGGAGGSIPSGSGSSPGSGGGAGGGGGVNLSPSKSGYNGSASGGGGGWGATGGGYFYGTATTPFNGYSGGSAGVAGSALSASPAGGKAINLGGKTVTWTGGSSSSSRAYGAVS